MQKIQFTLDIYFSGDIKDTNGIPHENEFGIAENILRAIKNEVSHGMGITPDGQEEFTESVSIFGDHAAYELNCKDGTITSI